MSKTQQGTKDSIKDKGPCMSYFYFKDFSPRTSRGCNGQCGLSHDVVQLGKIGQEKCIRKNCRFFHQYVRGANQKLNLCAFYHEGDELKVKVAQKWSEVKEDDEILNLHSIEDVELPKEKLKTKQMKETPCMSYFATGHCIIKGCKKSHEPKVLGQVGSTICYRGELCQKSTRMVTKNISFCSFFHAENDKKKLDLAKRWELYEQGGITKDQIFDTNYTVSLFDSNELKEERPSFLDGLIDFM